MSDAPITFKKKSSSKAKNRRRKRNKSSEPEEDSPAEVAEKIEVAKLEQRLRKRVRGLGASTFGDAGVSMRAKQGSQSDVSVEFTESTQVTQLDEAMEEYIQTQIEQTRRRKDADEDDSSPVAASADQMNDDVVVDVHEQAAAAGISNNNRQQQQQQQQHGVRGWATATTRQHLVEEVDLGEQSKRAANEETLQALRQAEKDGRLPALDRRLVGQALDQQALKRWKNAFFKRN